MLPFSVENFFAAHQDLLWVFVVAIDLSITLLLYRLFGKMGLYTIVILNVMLSNLQGPKLTIIFGLETSLGVILYSGIYFATDLLSEKYGKKEGQRAVWLGFASSIIMVLVLYISLRFLPSPPHPSFDPKDVHDAIDTLSNFAPQFVFGSLFAYLVSQSFDVWIFHYLREKTQGKHLWLRNNASTMASQALDTVVYGLVVWTALVDIKTALMLAFVKYFFKVLIALIDTIFIYWAREWDMTDKDWNESNFEKKQNSYEKEHEAKNDIKML
jgi:queuosine precursor transporter